LKPNLKEASVNIFSIRQTSTTLQAETLERTTGTVLGDIVINEITKNRPQVSKNALNSPQKLLKGVNKKD
jgi:hypothetical protein